MLTKKYGHVRTLQLAKRNEILQNISTCPQKIKANYLHQKIKKKIKHFELVNNWRKSKCTTSNCVKLKFSINAHVMHFLKKWTYTEHDNLIIIHFPPFMGLSYMLMKKKRNIFERSNSARKKKRYSKIYQHAQKKK